METHFMIVKPALRILALLYLSALVSPQAFAQQSDEVPGDIDALFSAMNPPQAAGAAAPGGVSLSGEHKSVLPVYTKSRRFGYGESAMAPLLHRFGAEASYENIKAAVTADVTQRYNCRDSTAYTELSLGEAYITYHRQSFLVSAGNLVFNWGSADGVNPTDWINPRDERNPFEAAKLPVCALAATLYAADEVSLECVLVPFKQRNIRSQNESEMIPDEMFAYAITGYDMAAGSLEYSHNRQITYERANLSPGSGAAALRARYFSPAIDTSLSLGYDRDPFFTPDIALVRQSDASGGGSGYMVEKISLRRPGIWRGGFDLKAAAGRYTMWSESALSFGDNFGTFSCEKRTGEFASTAGIDRSFGPEECCYINFQYNLRYIPGYDSGFYRDYRGGKPDISRSGDEKYMSRYYYRALVQNLANQYSEYLHTAVIHHEWKIIENRLSLESDLGWQLPLGYSRNGARRIGTLISGVHLAFVPGNALQIKAGINQCLPLKYVSGKEKLLIDRASELSGSYEKSYIYLSADYRWEARL